MTYEEALQKINDRLLFGVKPGLERIQALCDALGNPEKRTRFVHWRVRTARVRHVR